MAKIDALLDHMTQHGATRALLQANAPATLEAAAGTTQGQTLSGAQLQGMIDEIIPAQARQSLSAHGQADFTYSAPSGPFNVRASQPNGDWRLEVQPATVPFEANITPAIETSPVEPSQVEPSQVEPSQVEPSPTAAPAVNIAKAQAPTLDASPNNAPPPSPYAPPPPPAGVGSAHAPNDSGMGDASVLPAELRGFSWGGLLGSWIWGIGNNVWLGLLGLVPCLGFFMRFYLGSKGNELAWKSKRWESVQAFRSAQTTWTIVGVALIGASLFGMLIMSAILFPVFARARENARRSSCQSNLKQIALAVKQFNVDHKDTYPKGTTMAQWKPQLTPYLGGAGESLFDCPSHTGAGESYKVNPALSGLSEDQIPDAAMTPMITESQPDLHLGGSSAAFADGHVKWFRDGQINSNMTISP